MITITPIDISQSNIKRTAELAKALGHPARIAILKLLSERDSCVCGDITDQLPLAQSTVSQHLKALKSAGLIQGNVEGVRTCYCLDPKGINELTELLAGFSQNLVTNYQNNCC
ncbi:MAG: winged helix-turn-helix transcriptional regulator [Balneolaceae bacterium]|nr:winged helix-turn-helix transcriptional regulator [Balneolaceae bacterium]